MSGAGPEKIGELPGVYEGVIADYNPDKHIASVICKDGVKFNFQGKLGDPIIYTSLLTDPHLPKEFRLPTELWPFLNGLEVTVEVAMDSEFGPIVLSVQGLKWDKVADALLAGSITGTLHNYHPKNPKLGYIKRDEINPGPDVLLHASKFDDKKLPDLKTRLSFRTEPSRVQGGLETATDVKIVGAPSAEQPVEHIERRPDPKAAPTRGLEEGRIVTLKKGRGFGFIEPDDNGPNIFFLISDKDYHYLDPTKLEVGTWVRFRKVPNPMKPGEIKAGHVKIIGDPSAELEKEKALDGYVTGAIRFINRVKGFGFIQRDDGKPDVFFFRSYKSKEGDLRHNLNLDALTDMSDPAKQATRVRFRLEPSERKPGTFNAIGIELIKNELAAQIRPAGQEVGARQSDIKEQRPAAGSTHRDPKPPGRDGQT